MIRGGFRSRPVSRAPLQRYPQSRRDLSRINDRQLCGQPRKDAAHAQKLGRWLQGFVRLQTSFHASLLLAFGAVSLAERTCSSATEKSVPMMLGNLFENLRSFQDRTGSAGRCRTLARSLAIGGACLIAAWSGGPGPGGGAGRMRGAAGEISGLERQDAGQRDQPAHARL